MEAEKKDLLETTKCIGDGMQAKIYLANDHDGKEVCLKIFKRDQEVTEFQNSAEEEYRLS